MQPHLAAVPTDQNLPKGITADIPLPSPELGKLWDSIILDKPLKQQLLAQAILNFRLRRHVPRTVLPLHGVILMVGPPGTGKTSLARGLAHRVAEAFPGGNFRLLEVDPHTLQSSMLGKSQRSVTELFSQSVAEAAERGPTIVLLDEVETLAADRAKMSLDANPIDTHRATDAVLVQLDALAQRFPDLLIVATSNFPRAVDAAFTSRCDLVLPMPLPDAVACRAILFDTLSGLAEAFPAIGLLTSASGFDDCAAAAIGLDGRAIRKAVASSLSRSLAVAVDPSQLTLNLVRDALEAAKKARDEGGLG